MRLQHIDIAGFKSFAKKSTLTFTSPVTAVVGPNGSGKSNVVEAFRFVLGEQSMKSMRGKSGADLIFRGSNNTAKLSRASVSITFDNTDKVFAFQNQYDTGHEKTPVLFDVITFSRELYADGTSKYLMNGTEVRLKQVVELLASVNIGTSSHHIISQGEADSILRAPPRDRREMLEDALGLKIYHMRIKESESKLARSLETLKEVQSLRRELAPHLKFLQKQVEKIEKGRVIRNELEETLLQYLATERTALFAEEDKLAEAWKLTDTTKKRLLEELRAFPEEGQVIDNLGPINELRSRLAQVRANRSLIEQKMARLEGIIEAHRSMLARPPAQSTPSITFQENEYHQILRDIDQFITLVRSADTVETIKALLVQIENVVAQLKDHGPKDSRHISNTNEHSGMLRDTALELEGLERNLKGLLTDQEVLENQLKVQEEERESHLVQAKATTKERYEIQAQLTQCDAELQILEVSRSSVRDRKEHFDTELKEAAFLFGPSFLRALENTPGIPELDLHTHRRTIDRLKIRLDEHSGIGNDVLGEYESTKERDIFLAREVADTEASIRNLESLIIDLKRVLDEKFSTGVQVINERFGEFFKTMFGGGSAFLSITVEQRRRKKGEEFDVEEEENDEHFMERGIDVHVNLPEKKVKELHMLSGGERSLVSIALLFAISQVNPPPFLVLDETDAALDEANSRKYGDMVEKLAAYSQLIVVTHNRETMSRANVLYGVTLGSDGASKLLSIKFDDAVKVAK